MKTIILCGGRGYRLKEETDFKPKPMIRIGQHPILWHIMKIYSHFGFREFIIALGYKGEMIKEYFLNHKYYSHDFTLDTQTGSTRVHWKTQRERDNFKITFVDTGENTLTSGRVLKLKPYLKRDSKFLLTYGDGVGDIDIRKLVKFHNQQKRNHQTIGTITGVYPISKWGLVKTNKDSIAQKFKEKPRMNQYINGGFMVLEKRILKYFREDEQVENSLERIVPDNNLSLYPHRGYWYAMDTYRDVKILNGEWKKNPKWKVWQ